MSEWPPIETAPKDGTSIIGGCFDSWDDERVVRCWFQPEFEAFISGCRVMTLAPGLTFEDGSTRQLHSPKIERPTHWMPCPPSPTSNATTSPTSASNADAGG